MCPRCLLGQANVPSTGKIDRNSSLSGTSPCSEPKPIHRFGDYELLDEIARGGMGIVYRARQISLNRVVAVKMLGLGRFSNSSDVRRFRKEAEAVASLRHPHIVAVHEIGDHEGQHYFTMDYVPGGNLADLLRDQPLPARRAASLLRTAAEAVHYAHQQGVIHRDLKPSNILLDPEGRPHVTDFGLAKTEGVRCPTSAISSTEDINSGENGFLPDLTVTGQILGTPSFISPEQARGQRDITAAADVYSLGAIVYFLLTGRPPFVAGSLEETLRQVLQDDPISPRMLNPAIPRDLETICLKCLEKAPHSRYGSARELAEELGRFARDEPILARPVTRPEKLLRWCRRQPELASALGACILAGALGIAGISWQWRRAEINARAAEANSAQAVAKLRESYVAQAQATRLSRRPGQRFETLAAISNAIALRPTEVQRGQLRNQAIAAMALPDLAPIWTLNNTNRSWNGGSIDLTRSRFALVKIPGRVQICQIPDSSVIFELPQRDVPAHLPLDFSSDGKFLAVCYADSRVAVWDLGRRQIAVEDVGRMFRPEIAAFTADCSRVAIAGTNGTVAIWDLATRRRVCAIQNESQAGYVTFDPAGKQLAIGLQDDTILLVADAQTGGTLRTFDHPHIAAGSGWHPTHPLLAVACADGTVRLWNTQTGEPAGFTPNSSGECGSAVFTHRGDLLLSATWPRLEFWKLHAPLSLGQDPSVPSEIKPTFRAMGNGSQLRFSADDRSLSRIEWGFPEPKLEIDAFSSAPEMRVFHGPRDPAGFPRFALSDDGSLAALAFSNSVQLLDVETGIELARLPLPGAREPVLLPGHAGLVATSDSGLVTWSFHSDSRAGEIRISSPRLLSSSTDLTHIRLGPRGRHLAVWHIDHAHVYSLPEFQPVLRTRNQAGSGTVLGPSFSPDEDLIAVARWNNEAIEIFSLATSNLIQTGPLNARRGQAFGRGEFTPDGRWLLVATPAELRLYDRENWALSAALPWKSGANQITFLEGGKVVAIGAVERTASNVHLLTVPEFRELAVLEAGGDDGIAYLAASGDGRKLLVLREGGEINVWNLPLIAAGLAEMGLDWDALLPNPDRLQPTIPPRFVQERSESQRK